MKTHCAKAHNLTEILGIAEENSSCPRYLVIEKGPQNLQMKGRLIVLLLFGTFTVWLVGSYLPPDILFQQMIPGEGLIAFFRVALVISALLFVVIQIMLIAAAFTFPQRIQRQDDGFLADDVLGMEGKREIIIQRRWEVLWTAVPLVVSVGLFIVSYCVLVS